jgi:hypothetical protein
VSARLQQLLVDELRPCAGGTAPTMRELRLALDCSAAEVAAAVQALRYQGKLALDALELSPSMIMEAPTGAEPSPAPVETEQPGAFNSAAPAAEGPAVAEPELPHEAAAGPDDDDDYPSEVNDGAPPVAPEGGDEGCTLPIAAGPPAGSPCYSPAEEQAPGEGFVSARQLHQAGVHAAITRAGAKPLPAPAHEPEVARQVREEVQQQADRRYRARSTGTVRQPLELRKFGVQDMNLSEALGTMLTETPRALLLAVQRKHPKLWRRAILLGRTRGQSPMLTVYAAIEIGLAELEQSQPEMSDAT